MKYDKRTMARLMSETYGPKNKTKDKQIIVREIVKKTELNNSNITIDEHKGQDRDQV